MSEKQAQDFLDTRPWLSRICDTQSTEELKNKYDSWANTYNVDVKEELNPFYLTANPVY